MNTARLVPIRLYLLQLALGDEGTPVPAYLIQTNAGKNILVDTGIPLDGSFSLNGGHDMQVFSIIEQLATLGLTPRNIDMLVCTHFDPDHSGSHDAFLWSEFIVQRSHYEFACSSESPRFTLTRPHWNHPDLRYRLIEGDTELVPGVELIETSGHVPGHQAVLVRLPKTGPILLAIDAAAFEEDLNPETREYENGVDLDPAQANDSAGKLFALVQHEGVKLTVFGHDEHHWPALKKAPDYYS